MSVPAAGAITCLSCVELNKLFQTLAMDEYSWSPIHNCVECGGTGDAPQPSRTDGYPASPSPSTVGPHTSQRSFPSPHAWGDLSKIGTRLESWRRQRRRSQRELAALCGISVRRISSIERGFANPTSLELTHLAAALHVDVADLTGRPAGVTS